MDRRDVGGWLDGPAAALERDPARGTRLGLPADGSGSMARFGPRLLAVIVDWAIAMLLAYVLFHVGWGATGPRSMITLGIFAVEYLVMLPSLGSTVGQAVLGIGVMRLDGRRVGLVPTTVRTVLLCLAIPALVWDRDGRGLHDRAAGTVVARRR